MIFITFLIQTTIGTVFKGLYITPNLLLILTVSMGFMRGRKAGIWTGFFAGLLYDIFYGTLFGMDALLFMYIGFVNGFFYKVFFDRDMKAPLLLVGGSDLVYGLLYYVLNFAFRRRFDFGSYLKLTILPETVMTMLFSLLFYRIYYAINRRLVAHELEEQQSPWLRK